MTRVLLVVLGVLAVAVGVVGIFLPVLPTTPFLLVAAWAFARSSPRLHRWLRDHERLGVYVRDWEDHGVVPVRAKVLAIAMMSASVAYVALATDAPAAGVAAMALLLGAVAVWLLTRPSRRDGA